MKFKIRVCNKGETKYPWEEDYDIDTKDPQAWAEDTIKRFNSALRPGERERYLLNVEVIDEYSVKDHTWEKQNLVTVAKAGEYYDILKCGRCGITARRFGINQIVLDWQFKGAKVYQRCDTSLAHLKKKRREK